MHDPQELLAARAAIFQAIAAAATSSCSSRRQCRKSMRTWSTSRGCTFLGGRRSGCRCGTSADTGGHSRTCGRGRRQAKVAVTSSMRRSGTECAVLWSPDSVGFSSTRATCRPSRSIETNSRALAEVADHLGGRRGDIERGEDTTFMIESVSEACGLRHELERIGLAANVTRIVSAPQSSRRTTLADARRSGRPATSCRSLVGNRRDSPRHCASPD